MRILKKVRTRAHMEVQLFQNCYLAVMHVVVANLFPVRCIEGTNLKITLRERSYLELYSEINSKI